MPDREVVVSVVTLSLLFSKTSVSGLVVDWFCRVELVASCFVIFPSSMKTWAARTGSGRTKIMGHVWLVLAGRLLAAESRVFEIEAFVKVGAGAGRSLAWAGGSWTRAGAFDLEAAGKP